MIQLFKTRKDCQMWLCDCAISPATDFLEIKNASFPRQVVINDSWLIVNSTLCEQAS